MSLLRRFCGSEFQTVGPETRKLYENRSAVFVHVGQSDHRGQLNVSVNVQQPSGPEHRMSLKYAGHRPRAQSKTVSAFIVRNCNGLDTCYSSVYMNQTRDQQRFTISEVAADWHEPMVPQRIMWPSITRANGQLDQRCS